MNKSLFLAFILFFLFSSCQLFEKKSTGSADLQQTVQKVIAGTDTTSKLIGLRDKQLPAANDPNLSRQIHFILSAKGTLPSWQNIPTLFITGLQSLIPIIMFF